MVLFYKGQALPGPVEGAYSAPPALAGSWRREGKGRWKAGGEVRKGEEGEREELGEGKKREGMEMGGKEYPPPKENPGYSPGMHCGLVESRG